MSEYVVCLVTAPSPEVARQLALTLLESRLIACANLVPQVSSLYWWQGAVQEDQEVLMVLKTAQDRVAALIAAVREHHPYEVPEVVVLDIQQGNPAYLDWLLISTRRGSEGGPPLVREGRASPQPGQ